MAAAEFTDLMAFYQSGRDERDFEGGIGAALEAILASPQFLFRLETMPDGVTTGTAYKLRDVDLASRLSFFLWGTGPDQALVQQAAQGRLTAPAMLERQVRAHARRPALRGAGAALRRPVAAAARRRGDPARRAALSRTSTARSAGR